MDNEEKYLLNEINRKLTAIALNTGTTADDSYQFPRPNESTFQIPAGGTYARTLYPKKRLRRLTVSVPDGVTILILKDGTAWRRYAGIFAYDDGVNGEYFNQFDIIVQNSGANAASWNVIATFS